MVSLHLVAHVDDDDMAVIVAQRDAGFVAGVGVAGTHAELRAELPDGAQAQVGGGVLARLLEEGVEGVEITLLDAERGRQAQALAQAGAAAKTQAIEDLRQEVGILGFFLADVEAGVSDRVASLQCPGVAGPQRVAVGVGIPQVVVKVRSLDEAGNG